jgi:L-aspartate oxidase
MTESFDYLVLGSGAAGLSYALQVADVGTVAIITKKKSSESNTNYAQGGIAAAIRDDDSTEAHLQDTLVAGAGLCDESVVRTIVNEGPARIRQLQDLGARFSADDKGGLHLGREGGHGTNRIVHAADATGHEVEMSLLERVAGHPNIVLFEYHFALELITEHHLGQTVTRVRPDIRCFGAYVFDEQSGSIKVIRASVTMLATGGAGHIYLHTTNPEVATGDGIAMAYRAKARVENLEFVQFHPTSLFHEDADSFLISEAVRGDGAVLRNLDGHRFMPEYDDRAELAPRDIVARAIDDQLKTRGESHVLLDITDRSADYLQSRFPTIYATCIRYGINIADQPIPVVPAAHYMCGGVKTDVNGQTSIQRLLACGEVACTGLHGANRLASNSLLEALVVSHRAADYAGSLARMSPDKITIPDWDDGGTKNPAEWVLISHNRDELKRIMWDYVGIVRSSLRLERAARRTGLLFEETEDFYKKSAVSAELCELRNMIAVAYLIIRSATLRRESRGLHFMTDYPHPETSDIRSTII